MKTLNNTKLNKHEAGLLFADTLRYDISRSLDAFSLPRRMLLVDELPIGAYPRFDIEPKRRICYVNSKKICQASKKLEEATIPFFEISHKLSVDLTKIDDMQYIQKIRDKALCDLLKMENNYFRRLLRFSANYSGKQFNVKKLGTEEMSNCFRQLESDDLLVSAMLTSKSTNLRNNFTKSQDENLRNKTQEIKNFVKDYGQCGFYWTATAYTNKDVENMSYLLTSQETLGTFNIRNNLNYLSTIIGNKMEMVGYEKIGMAIIYPENILQIRKVAKNV